MDLDMQSMAMNSPHMTMTPHRDERPGDRARADSIVRVARSAVERYRDVAVAEADGFKRFAPQVKHQRVYHYTSASAALKARFKFAAASPTALLYQENETGSLKLIGVMYTMPASASFNDLDQRIPLSIAHWHQHTNICLPPKGDGAEGMLVREARFGVRGSIASEDACVTAGGRWFPRMFGWMVHVNLLASTPAGVWEDDPGGMRHN
jgi:hypothetical protein